MKDMDSDEGIDSDEDTDYDVGIDSGEEIYYNAVTRLVQITFGCFNVCVVLVNWS